MICENWSDHSLLIFQIRNVLGQFEKHCQFWMVAFLKESNLVDPASIVYYGNT